MINSSMNAWKCLLYQAFQSKEGKNSDNCRRVLIGLLEDNVLDGRKASRLLVFVQMLQAFCHDRQKALYYECFTIDGFNQARLFSVNRYLHFQHDANTPSHCIKLNRSAIESP
jgi:hypothetical protein